MATRQLPAEEPREGYTAPNGYIRIQFDRACIKKCTIIDVSIGKAMTSKTDMLNMWVNPVDMPGKALLAQQALEGKTPEGTATALGILKQNMRNGGLIDDIPENKPISLEDDQIIARHQGATVNIHFVSGTFNNQPTTNMALPGFLTDEQAARKQAELDAAQAAPLTF